MDATLRVPASQLVSRVPMSVRKGLHFLMQRQRPEGAWEPLWFGNEAAPDEANLTYGTARVLLGLLAWRLADGQPARRAVQWLLMSQNRDGSWGGQAGLPGSVEETALAIDALAAWLEQVPKRHGEWLVSASIHKGLHWLVDAVQTDNLTPTPIGLYFARLWYFERLYPMIFATQALRRAFRVLFHTSEGSPLVP
jgi:squalene-hopene/tetraprenyl-beta-curcumene cyclase